MKKIQKALTAAAFLAVGAASQATAGVVSAGGIQWDTVPLDGQASMNATVNYQQWFTLGQYGTKNGVFVIDEDSNDFAEDANENPLLGVGQLTGLGVFKSLSDKRNPLSPSFCVAGANECELTFEFGGLIPQANGTFDFSQGWLNVYRDDGPSISDIITGTTGPGTFGLAAGSDSYKDFKKTQNGILWASFKFDFFDFTPFDSSNPFNAGSADAGLSVVGGIPEVVQALNFNDGVHDLFFTSETQFLSQPYSLTATASITSVNSPATIGFMGLAKVLIGGLTRKRA